MSHSILEFRGKQAIIDDLCVHVLMGLLCGDRDSQIDYKAINDMVNFWHNDKVKQVPGCIDIPFDSLFSTQHDVDNFLLHINQVKNAIKEFDSCIPKEHIMNPKYGVPYVVDDQDPKMYLSSLELIESLFL